METTATIDKATEKVRTVLKEKLPQLQSLLANGNFSELEQAVKEVTDTLYNDVIESVVTEYSSSPEAEEKAKVIAKSKNLRYRKTTVTIILLTGYHLRIPSFYGYRIIKKRKGNKRKGRRGKRGPNGSGCHLLLAYWGFIGKASPCLYSLLSMLCVLCPSFDVAHSVLRHQGINLDYKTIRRIVLAVGECCFAYRLGINIGSEERVSGKRIIVSVDGGRTRIRQSKKKKKPKVPDKELEKDSKYGKFDTPWKEPKLLVIQVLDEEGNLSKEHLPIYDAQIGHADKVFSLLEGYLKQLDIQAAQQVLFIGDGATWIWNRTKELFKKLGVSVAKYVEAIDYYHAAQHLYKIVGTLPEKNIVKEGRTKVYSELKEYLWNGNISALVKRAKELGKGKLPTINSLLGYFSKRPNLFNYKYLREQKLPCGSGVVESAIRRVINLRFKAPSSFWLAENVEKLIFLRATFLAGRWAILMNNIAKKLV